MDEKFGKCDPLVPLVNFRREKTLQAIFRFWELVIIDSQVNQWSTWNDTTDLGPPGVGYLDMYLYHIGNNRVQTVGPQQLDQPT